MTDQNSQFFAILTAVGEAKLANAIALGTTLTLAQMAVGDANETNPIPNRLQTKLINERRRAPLNQVKPDPANASVIIAEQIIPESAGGWWVRELALYDADGDMVAVANCAPTYKPLLSQGSGRTQVIRINLIVSSTANIELKIDPSVVLATRAYVDSSILAVLPPNKVAGTYHRVTIDKRGIVISGSNPTTLDDFGITDGFANSIPAANYSELKKNGLYSLGGGVTGGRPPEFSGSGAIHHNVGDFAFTLAWNLSSDDLAFQRIEPGENGVKPWRVLWSSANFDPAKKANLQSPGFTGAPTTPTASEGTNNKQIANAEFVWSAINTYAVAVTTSLGLKANLDSPTLTGVPKAPTAEVGTSTKQLATTEFVKSTLDAIDPWAMQPIGAFVALAFHVAPFALPPTNKGYRYISLTANDSYNAGVLTGEVVSGSAPSVIATAVVGLADSPLVGKTINLINTEQRVLRGSQIPGQLLQDALQNITGTLTGALVNGVGTGAFTFARTAAAATFDGANNYGSVTFDASRTSRTDVETRAKSIGVTYFLRVR